MPVLSSFIPYRQKRKTKAPKSPFIPVRRFNSPASPHPYASPRIIDINDADALQHQPPAAHSGYQYGDVSSAAGPSTLPKVMLDLDLKPEPLADWFPPNMLNSSSARLDVEAADRDRVARNGNDSDSGSQVPYVVSTSANGSPHLNADAQLDGDDGISDEDLEISSSEDYLAVIQQLDASAFVNVAVPENVTLQHGQPQPNAPKKHAPSPIKIPNATLHGSKVQVVRSTDVSRPTSQISSPESSAISGQTLARALLGNAYVFSGDSRASRYRSGGSLLTRSDSATLPRSEFALMHSPYWRDRTVSGGEFVLSPEPDTIPPVPPVPPKALYMSSKPRNNTNPEQQEAAQVLESSSPSFYSDRDPESSALPSASLPPSEGGNVQDFRTALYDPDVIVSPPLPPIPSNGEDATGTASRGPSPAPSGGSVSSRNGSSRHVDAEPPQPSRPQPFDTPNSPRDIDNVLDLYSFTTTPEVAETNNGFRLPFSPITEESSSQLSSPTPSRNERRESKRIGVSPRIVVASPSTGVMVDWNLGRRMSLSKPRDSVNKPLLPIGERPRSTQFSQPSPLSPTRPFSPVPPSASLAAAASDLHQQGQSSGNNGLAPPPLSSIFNRQRSGSAPSPIKVVRDSRDFAAYNIMVTPLSEHGTAETPSTGTSDGGGADMEMQQTFPETPSAFSPAFSVASPGILSASVLSPSHAQLHASGEYAPPLGVPQTPMSARLLSSATGPESIMPSFAQQVLLTRAATSVHGARHSRQASLTRLVRLANHPYAMPPPPPSPEPQPELEPTTLTLPSPPLMPPQQQQQPESGSAEPERSETDGADRPAGAQSEARPVESIEPAPLSFNVPASGTPPRMGRQPDEEGKEQWDATALPKASGGSGDDSVSAKSVGTTHSSKPASLSSPTKAALPQVALPLNDATERSVETGPATVSAVNVVSPASGSFSEPSDIYSGIIPSNRPPSVAGSQGSYANPPSNDPDRFETTDTQNQRIPLTIPVLPQVPSVPPPLPPLSPRSEYIESFQPVQGRSKVTLPDIPIDAPMIRPVDLPQVYTPLVTPDTSSSSGSPAFPPGSDRLPARPHPSTTSLYSSFPYEAAISNTFGSPPPYHAAIQDRIAHDAGTPTTSNSYDPFTFSPPYQPHSPGFSSQGVGGGGSSSSSSGGGGAPISDPVTSPNPGVNRRTRMRHPVGPRRPSNIVGAGRDRNGSISSLTSNLPTGSSGGRRPSTTPVPPIKFQTPPIRWKGYTMDAAKWTFTSAQLQAVVSKAIKQTAETSSIRLLHLETYEKEIPEELERLETQRNDIKVRYKTLARRRAYQLEVLSMCIENSDTYSAARVAEDLKELTATLDRHAEELHSVDEQVAQLQVLLQVHSASALSMALRKLNKRFLEHFAEAQELRKQVAALEAEREEAWKLAQDVAHDYDDLYGRVESPNSANRSSRVVAVRKSSIRASRAGLRVSHRSSASSAGRGPSSARNTVYSEDIPPVPPIPRHRPRDINTDIALRSSSAISTAGLTPNSETRAMVHAQEELYEMLGLSLSDGRARRSRSVIGLHNEGETTSYVVSPPTEALRLGRRASLPGTAPPPDNYNALTADVSIILTSDREGWI